MLQETVDILTSIGGLRVGAVPTKIDVSNLPHAALSYASGGEDLALRRYFKARILSGKPGVYVDVGCAAPASLSNTYLFYNLGWRGVCFDANPEATPYWKATRPDDIFLNAAVGSYRSVQFFRHKHDPGMSRIAQTCPSEDYEAGFQVPGLLLGDALHRHIPGQRVQLMSIDVEGAELAVLSSNDWEAYSPEVVIIECHGFDLANPIASETISFLVDIGYRVDGKIGENVIVTR